MGRSSLPKAVIRLIVEGLEAGLTQRGIAAKAGCSTYAVRTWAAHTGCDRVHADAEFLAELRGVEGGDLARLAVSYLVPKGNSSYKCAIQRGDLAEVKFQNRNGASFPPCGANAAAYHGQIEIPISGQGQSPGNGCRRHDQ